MIATDWVTGGCQFIWCLMYSRNIYAGNPLGVSGNYDRLPMAPYFLFKDLITIFLFVIILSIFVFFMSNVLGDSENYVIRRCNHLVTVIMNLWLETINLTGSP